MTTHRFSIPDYYRMGELGLLNQRTELVTGLVVDLEPITPRHADIVTTLTQSFTRTGPPTIQRPGTIAD